LRAVHDAFYRGDIARAIVAYHRDHGGWLAAEDLDTFEVEVAPAVRGRFRSMEVCTCGFWSQGPTLIQMLNLLEGIDLRALGQNSDRYLHVLVEVVKLAFADRHRIAAIREHCGTCRRIALRYADLRRIFLHSDHAWPGLPPPGDPWSAPHWPTDRWC
jgi:gamma-glutamyltranspeptidase/glutathione hydrolase